jgi:hypothetical protein
MTPGHVPPILSIPIEKRVGADAQLALLDLDPRPLAGGLLASGTTIRCMLCTVISIAFVWCGVEQLTQAPFGALACVFCDAFHHARGSCDSRHVGWQSCGV